MLALALSIPQFHEPILNWIVIKASDDVITMDGREHSKRDQVTYVSRAFVWAGAFLMVQMRLVIPFLIYWKQSRRRTLRV